MTGRDPRESTDGDADAPHNRNPMNTTFADSVVLVAGGTGGLGRAVSQAFLAAGAQVHVTYRNDAEFGALGADASAARARLEGHKIDIGDEAALLRMVDDIVARRARLDVLVNAIGGFVGGSTLWDSDAGVLSRMLAQNLEPGYALARAVVPTMIRAGKGAIVNVAAKSGIDHPARTAAYAASKAAAIALMDSLAAEVAGTGVRVNSVLPSIIDTAANRKSMPAADFSKWPKADDIARVILFLCSSDARVIHGAAIPVYGDR